jgi:4-hydroxythreonine-4-phosphate dehydrogenase
MIGITIGDPYGIGPELIHKVFSTDLFSSQAFICYCPNNLASTFKIEGLLPIQNISYSQSLEFVKEHKPTKEGGEISYQAILQAINDLKAKRISAVVTTPISKVSFSLAGIKYTGHTEIFAHHFGLHPNDVVMLLTSEQRKLRVALATRHIPINAVAKAITIEGLIKTIKIINESMQDQWKLPKPKIAVCGLNPHAGDEGVIGTEEQTIIKPAIEACQKMNINVSGPFPADSIFIPENQVKYNVILAMYHDQGLPVIKSLAFDTTVNVTLGLPVIRTSPDHGTAFDIAGKGIANPSSMIEAIRLAQKLGN